MSRSNFLGVFGHVAVDVICSVDRFPRPNTCEAIVDRRTEFGGTAGNMAVFAASLGVPTALASLVGDDFPSDYMDFLKSKRIDLTDLKTIKGRRTPSVIMVSDASHNQVGFVDQGAILAQDKLPLQKHTIDTSQIVHVGTGRPAYALQVCKRARKMKKTVAFDPAQEIHYVYDARAFSKVIKEADIFFCNESELSVAKKYLRRSRAEDLLDIVDTLIVTMGKRGSRIMTSGGEDVKILPCRAKRVVDTTGAGDAYRAGFYAGMRKRMDLADCGALASAAASFAVESFGGQTNLPSWSDVCARAFGKRG
jgi:sugar/nucleoside kinase (ribokinase family)